MKYLVIAKRNNVPVPQELGLRLARALKKYLNAGVQEGRFDCVYFFEEGAMSINNASSHEEALGQISDNPYWPFVTWEIKALGDMNQIADKTIESWERLTKKQVMA